MQPSAAPRLRAGTLTLLLGLLGQAAALTQDTGPERQRQEEREDYYRKWLQEDVVYIITEREKDVFEKLTTDQEREQFIEQFWLRRDPDLRTAVNEFKEEHYRRIAYANERFFSGVAGWMTDRGRIYIIHGEPAEIEEHPTGGQYNRPFHEGGGRTTTYPFEVWRYRFIEGVGSDVEIEFVDPTGSGEYRIALTPDEKDALLHVPGAGLTAAEEMGLAKKLDRPYFSPGNRDYPLMSRRLRDDPFERYERLVKVQRPLEIEYSDLQQLVEVNVAYDDLPFAVALHYLRLNAQRLLVPLTLALENRNLTFAPESGLQVAKLAVYGIVTSMTGRVTAEFEDDLVTSYPAEGLEQGLQGQSMYQKVLSLDGNMRYKLDLVIKDLRSGKVGVARRAIIPPPSLKGDLAASSLILSDLVRRAEERSKDDQMFVLGDLWVRPRLEAAFARGRPLSCYLQIYGARLDQSTLEPSLRVALRVLRDGRPVHEDVDEAGESVHFFSSRRIVLVRQVPTDTLEPGSYTLEVGVRDRVGRGSLTLREHFEISE